jgi:hypothetical protein
MLTRMDRDEAIAELRRVKRLRERAEAARNAATKATDPAIADALRAGLRPVEIVAECGVSDSHVRAVRRANKIPPNPSYANLTPPVRTKTPPTTDARPTREAEPWAEPSPPLRPLATLSEAQLPARIRELPPPRVAAIIAEIRREMPTFYEQALAEAAGAPPLFRDLLVIKHAQDDGVLEDLGIELP